MALGTPINANVQNIDRLVRPVGIGAPINTIIQATGLDDQDAATITDPAAEITKSTTIPLVCKGGTTLHLSVAYDDGDATITDVVVKVFGRFTDTERWRKLSNRALSFLGITLQTDTTNDASDGTLNFTDSHPTNHAWDLNGCEEIVVGIETPYNATTGAANPSAAFLQAWVV